MHQLYKRDVKGILKTITFVGAAIVLYLGLSWLWQQYGRDTLTPVLGPVAEKVIEPVMHFGALVIDNIRELFFTYIFLPTVGIIGKISPKFAGILMKTRVLFTLVVVIVFALVATIIEIFLVILKPQK